jgi:phospholipase/carboxylesterase
MREAKLGPLTVRIAGGADREGGGDGPVLVLMHGFGAPGTDLVPLFRALRVAPEVRFVFPAAPLVLDPRAPAGSAPRAWWMIDMLRLQTMRTGPQALELARETPAGLAAAREAVNAMLAALATELNAPLERVVLGGFSQGAMLACDVALRAERAPAGLVLLSGAPICEQDWRGLAPKRSGLRVLQSHGRADPVLPFVGAEWLCELLREGGLAVDFVPFSGGHGIPDGVLDRLGPFVDAVTSA